MTDFTGAEGDAIADTVIRDGVVTPRGWRSWIVRGLLKLAMWVDRPRYERARERA